MLRHHTELSAHSLPHNICRRRPSLSFLIFVSTTYSSSLRALYDFYSNLTFFALCLFVPFVSPVTPFFRPAISIRCSALFPRFQHISYRSSSTPRHIPLRSERSPDPTARSGNFCWICPVVSISSIGDRIKRDTR